jgi:hypothetical protein
MMTGTPGTIMRDDDPRDLAELQYPELERRRDALAGEIERITIEGGAFDGRLRPRLRDLEAVRDALTRKRAASAGKGTPRKRGQGDDGGAGDAGDDGHQG